MTTTATALVPVRPAFSNAGRLALAGLLAGYRGLTREADALDRSSPALSAVGRSACGNAWRSNAV